MLKKIADIYHIQYFLDFHHLHLCSHYLRHMPTPLEYIYHCHIYNIILNHLHPFSVKSIKVCSHVTKFACHRYSVRFCLMVTG